VGAAVFSRVNERNRLLTTVIYTFAVIPQIIFDMTTCSTFRVAIAFSMLLPLGAVAQKPAADAANVSETEYEVFSAYINHSFVGAIGRDRVGMPISQIVIVNRTESDKDDLDDRFDPHDMPPGGIERYLQKEATSLRAVTINNFHQANKKQADLALGFHIRLPYPTCVRGKDWLDSERRKRLAEVLHGVSGSTRVCRGIAGRLQL